MKETITIEKNELKRLGIYADGMNRIKEQLQAIYNSDDKISQHSEVLRKCSGLANKLSGALKKFTEEGKISDVDIDIF